MRQARDFPRPETCSSPDRRWRMKTFAIAVLLAGAALPLVSDSKDPLEKTGPEYNPATVVDFKGTITDVREVSAGSAIEGVNLTIKVKGETLKVYVAPTEFVKFFD